VHAKPSPPGVDSNAPLDESLPSLSMNALIPSPPEVLHIFHQPFSSLINPSQLREHSFRGGEPYYAIDVTSEVQNLDIAWSASTGVDEVGGSGQVGKLEI